MVLNKKGIAVTETLVYLIIFAAITMIMLTGPIRKFQQKLGEKGGEKECQWTIVMSYLTRIGGIETVPPECRASKITITMDHLKANLEEAEKRIKTYHQKSEVYGRKNPLTQKSMLDYFSSTDENTLLEWSLDKIFAEQLRKCWEKVWQGKIPIFDKWWSIVDYKTEKGEGAAGYADLLGRFNQPPVNCIICSRIKFDKEVQEKFKGKQIESLSTWLGSNPLPKDQKKSYYEYLKDGQTMFTGLLEPTYKFNLNQPQGIIYARMNEHAIMTGAGKITDVGGQLKSAAISVLGVEEGTWAKWIAEKAIDAATIGLAFRKGMLGLAAKGFVGANLLTSVNDLTNEEEIKGDITRLIMTNYNNLIVKQRQKDGGLGCTYILD